MIQLGSMDASVQNDAIDQYFAKVRKLLATDFDGRLLNESGDRIQFEKVVDEWSVAEVQTALRDAGFYPDGASDGIAGYRTAAAIRLFQEYVRTSGSPEIGTPDGILGPKGLRHLKRFRDERLVADWSDHPTEHAQWIDYLECVKAHYSVEANRSRMLRMVQAHGGASDTRDVAEWDFGPRHIHVIGVRRRQRTQSTPGLDRSDQTFDDVIVLLVAGMVFKFQGSTEPGSTSHPRGAPFLVQGQHEYRLGWHRGQYQALKPANHGVLVVRSPDDYVLTDEDLVDANGALKPLEANTTINVHWAGKGVSRRVNRWSEGCQVIAGSGYINHRGEPVSCADFVATNRAALIKVPGQPRKTKGAYNVIADLVATFDGGRGNRVLYTLLSEEDLALDAGIAERLASAREVAKAMK